MILLPICIYAGDTIPSGRSYDVPPRVIQSIAIDLQQCNIIESGYRYRDKRLDSCIMENLKLRKNIEACHIESSITKDSLFMSQMKVLHLRNKNSTNKETIDKLQGKIKRKNIYLTITSSSTALLLLILLL